MNYRIVEMTKDNACEFARINSLSWLESYKGIIDDNFLNKINTSEEINKLTDKLINNHCDDHERFLLQVEDKYVGIFRIRKSKYEGYESYGELGALYLLNEAKGKGLGKILFEEAKTKLKDNGFDKMIVGCLEDNPSNEFYKHMRLSFEKKSELTIGEQNLFENVYVINI